MRRFAVPLLRCHPYSLAAGLVLLGVSVAFCLRTESEWDNVYLLAARRLAAGEGLYRPAGENYLYMPFMAWAALPFTLLPPLPCRLAWLALTLACLVFQVRGAWRLAGGPPLEGTVSAPRSEHLAALLGIACGLPHLQNCLAHQQTDIAIGALLIGGCLLLERGRCCAAAVCLGLATACKGPPLLWLPYLLYKRRPFAACCLLGVALGANLLPDLLSPPPSGCPRLVEYAERYLRPLSRRDHAVGTWGSDLIYNQSLAGACRRWLSTTWSWTAEDCAIADRTAALSPLVGRALVYGFGLLLLLGAAWAMGRNASDGENKIGSEALEYSLVLTLALLLSPMSSRAHFGVLIVPGFCLARAALRSRSPLPCALLALAVVLALAPNKGLVGGRISTLTLWYAATTWQTLVLWLGCAVVLVQQRQQVNAECEERSRRAAWREPAGMLYRRAHAAPLASSQAAQRAVG